MESVSYLRQNIISNKLAVHLLHWKSLGYSKRSFGNYKFGKLPDFSYNKWIYSDK